ncbi:valine--pyruvate transaminase [Catenovulum sediminis]|uniref:Valine--pyruvate transaminase n=1 Tax=Catenovulum sediminis TaxID=1740262 RepID=A0ABV1RCE8_9ALTE|nr:valine--pyruvate transaminase [Catenovulum sediminis]
MKLSDLGSQLSKDSGIVELMKDLGEALNVNPNLLFLGGGNPAQITQFENLMAEYLNDIAHSPEALHRVLGVYQSPQGSETLIEALAAYFQAKHGWPIGPKNIALSNGSQSAFFILINMLAGQTDGDKKHFLFPLVPEYLGYSDQALADDYFKACKPKIKKQGADLFKYVIDFDNLEVNAQTAAICVSRPTNPTGNVVTEAEILRLSTIAHNQNIPLIIDCAYGAPFPNLVYQDTLTPFDENTIYVFSLSKLGLPACRTGIVIASEEMIEKFVNVNTIMSLANGNLGPELMVKLLQDNKLDSVCKETLLPFYKNKRETMLNAIRQNFSGIKYRIHQPEGAFFIWLWFEDLPIPSSQLYLLLKEKGVLVMDGEPFFFALKEAWRHKQQCLRLSYCQSDEIIEKAVKIIAQTLRELY